jgi:hypothetical protein
MSYRSVAGLFGVCDRHSQTAATAIIYAAGVSLSPIPTCMPDPDVHCCFSGAVCTGYWNQSG